MYPLRPFVCGAGPSACRLQGTHTRFVATDSTADYRARMPPRKREASAATTHEAAATTGIDWYARDLSGEEHVGKTFTDLDLTEASGTGVVFTECTFRRARFNVARFVDCAFVNCTFAHCNFFEARFTECKLVGSTFERCTYDLMDVAGGNWSHVAMANADLGRATLRGVRMREADLTGVRCEDGVLRDVDLAGASLRGARLSRCDLRGSDLGALDPADAQLAGAIITYEQAIAIAVAMGLDVRAE